MRVTLTNNVRFAAGTGATPTGKPQTPPGTIKPGK